MHKQLFSPLICVDGWTRVHLVGHCLQLLRWRLHLHLPWLVLFDITVHALFEREYHALYLTSQTLQEPASAYPVDGFARMHIHSREACCITENGPLDHLIRQYRLEEITCPPLRVFRRSWYVRCTL